MYNEDWLLAQGHTACAGCGSAIAIKLALDALGKDIMVVNATGCSEIYTTPYPRSAFRVPYIHSLFENVPAVASGIAKALEVQGNDHTKVVCIAGDGSTYDIGFGSLSGMFERNDNVLYICYDNEAYMNTGVQRSSATPLLANTTTSQVGKKIHGKEQIKKPIVDIAAAHRIPYAASTSIGYHADLQRKVKKAAQIKGARFINIHQPCTLGWRYESQLTVQIARMAVECGLWKMYEVEDFGKKVTVNMQPKFTPVAEYLKLQRRFRHLTDTEIQEIQKRVNEEWSKG